VNAPIKPSPARTAADVAALVEALRPVLLRLSRRLRREADQVGLSALDTTLLTMIAKHPGIGVSDLADKERTSRPTMSTHVSRLETAGFVERQAPQADDRRRVGLTVTPQGTKAVEAVRRRRNDWLGGRLSELTPEQREAVLAAIEPLAQIAADRS
jgi:DNA-binding MarR family transcriptional regulator